MSDDDHWDEALLNDDALEDLEPDEPEEGDFGSDEYERTVNQRY